MSISEEIIQLVEAAWKLANIRVYVCPLFQIHPRAYVYPNKIMWESHMLQEHTAEQLKNPFNIKGEVDYQLKLYNEYMAQQAGLNQLTDTELSLKKEIDEKELARDNIEVLDVPSDYPFNPKETEE